MAFTRTQHIVSVWSLNPGAIFWFIAPAVRLGLSFTRL
jgi:hypothetical protein